MTAMEEPRTTLDTAVGEEICLVEIVGFFKRQWRIITAATAIATVAAVAYFGLFVQPLFKSIATLVVTSATVTPDPESGELSLLGYRRLLESEAVRARTEYELHDSQLLEPGESFRLESHALVPRRDEQTALAPLLELVGYASTPEKAAAVANTWASVFVELDHELAAAEIESALTPAQDIHGTVRIAAAAVPTGQQDSRGAVLAALLAAIAGTSAGLVVALLRELVAGPINGV